MAYSAPLSERIRIQIEILCENVTDCISNVSQNYRKQFFVLSGIAVILTMRSASRGVKSAKMGGYGKSSSIYGGYGGSTSKRKSLKCKLFKRGCASAYGTYGSSTYGGSSGMYGSSSYGSGGAGGLGGSTYGSSSYGAGAGLRGTTGTSMGGGSFGGGAVGGGGYGSSSSLGSSSTYGSSTLGGASSFGGASAGGYGSSSSFGGASSMNTMGGGAGGMSSGFGGGAVGGKSTSMLADSQPNAVITLDPSVHFYDYGGSKSFSGQIETLQARDSPSMVAQILNQPGQNKVLVIDGGGLQQGVGAVFDGDMANAAARNGWKGVIVHGLVRGADELSRTSFGVKALGTSPIKGKGAMGQKGMGLQIGSSQLQPGWWIYADGDGVVMSQQDVSGGSFGGGSTMMGGSTMGGSTMGGSTMGGSTMGGSMGAAGGMTGGYGGSSLSGGAATGYGGSSLSGGASGGLTGGYGSNSLSGGASTGVRGGTSTGLSGGYGGSGLSGGAKTGLTGGYSKPSASTYGGYGSSGSSSSSLYGGYSSYGGKKYSYRKKKNKVFKMLLASAIASLVWLICLR